MLAETEVPKIPQVDVVPDGFDWANVFIGLGGLFVALVAFMISLWVQRRAARSVIDERRRMFELDILRELAKDLDQPSMAGEVFMNPHTLDRFKVRLDLLSERMPFWDQVIAAKGKYDVADLLNVGDEYRLAESERNRLIEVYNEVYSEWADLYNDLNLREIDTTDNSHNPLLTPDEAAALGRLQRLQARRDTALAESNTAADQLNELHRFVMPLTGDKLAYDVRQLIWSRVEDPRGLRHRS